MTETVFTLRPVPPFRLDLTVWALRRQRHNMMDFWDGKIYTRVHTVRGRPVRADIMQEGPASDPALRITFRAETKLPKEGLSEALIPVVEKTLGTGKDLRKFYRLSRTEKTLGTLAEQFAGVKPPRFPSLFEALVNAFACQQVSLNVGITLLNRLALKYGAASPSDDARINAFPTPEALAHCTADEIRALGFNYNKARAIVELARGIEEKKVELGKLETMGDDDAVDYLTQLRGVGRWSAEYVLLRGLGRIHIFPSGDVGAQKSVKRIFHLGEKPGYARIKQLTSRWEPYAGFVYFHLLLNKLRERGDIT